MIMMAFIFDNENLSFKSTGYIIWEFSFVYLSHTKQKQKQKPISLMEINNQLGVEMKRKNENKRQKASKISTSTFIV